MSYMDIPPNVPTPPPNIISNVTPPKKPGLLQRHMKAILIGIGIAFAALGIVVLALYLLYPGEVSLFFSALSSVAKSPAQSSTFSSQGVSLQYPANWVTVNTSLFSSVALLQSNSSNSSTSRFGNKSQIVVTVPSAEVLSFAASGPKLLSKYLSDPENFTPPAGLGFVISGAVNVLKRSFSPAHPISEAVSGANLTNITISGYPGVHVAFFNQTILSVKELFSELSVAEYNGSICFVFGFTDEQNQISEINQSFYRQAQSIQCDFSKIGVSVPSDLLDKFLSILS